jgi:glutamate/tyrosine decarboxylase-like PLP-dependent enzyme
MNRGGEFARSLDNCLLAARVLWDRLAESNHYQPLMRPEIDIVVYAANAADIAESNSKAKQIFARAAGKNLHLALIELPAQMVKHYWPELDGEEETITCLRSCLMKPEHIDWIDRIVSILEESAN